ncbi:hypothetical protein, partial [Bifidobacterium sp.]
MGGLHMRSGIGKYIHSLHRTRLLATLLTVVAIVAGLFAGGTQIAQAADGSSSSTSTSTTSTSTVTAATRKEALKAKGK